MNNNAIRTRFAPSPTGFMHIGNLRTALYAYLMSKATNGQFIVRIEDTDQERLVEGAVEVILKTLEMTGLDYDEGPEIGGPNGPYVQSERTPIYKKYAEMLVASGHAYYCFCSQERLKSMHDENGIGGYDRHCRDLTPDEIKHHLDNGDPYVIRQKIPLEGVTSYHDEVFGDISINNAEMQDQILLKTDGFPTYNFAHVVDDHLMKITHVVRGSEYLTSTPKYVLLYDAFGWDRPHYVHLPLLMGKSADGKVSKLSKRHGAVSFQDLTLQGYLPEAIVNYIAFLGWCPKDTNQEVFTLDELKHNFSIDAINKSPAVFDYEKLRWFNAEYIKVMDSAVFAEETKKRLGIYCPHINIDKLASLLQSRVSTLDDVIEMSRFAYEKLPMSTDLYVNKKNKTTIELCADILTAVKSILVSCDEWSNAGLLELLKEYSTTSGIKAGAIMWAVRIAVARQAVTPGGATELMEVFGKDETINRIDYALLELAK